MVDLVEPVEVRHSFGARPELAHGLRTTEHQHGEQRALACIEPERLVEHVAVTDGGPAMGGQDETDQSLRFEAVERGHDGALVVVHDRVPVGGLIAGGETAT